MIILEKDKEIREMKRNLASMYSTAQHCGLVNTHGVIGAGTSAGGLNCLNGFNVTIGSSHHHQSSMVNSTVGVNDSVGDLVNRCFSSCSPSNVNNNNAGSPSSLSSDTPPLSGQGVSGIVMGDVARALCNVSPLPNVNSNVNTTSFSLSLSPSIDYSFTDGPLAPMPWPSSLTSKSSNNTHRSQLSTGSTPTQSDIIISSPTGISAGGNVSIANVGTCNSSGNNNNNTSGHVSQIGTIGTNVIGNPAASIVSGSPIVSSLSSSSSSSSSSLSSSSAVVGSKLNLNEFIDSSSSTTVVGGNIITSVNNTTGSGTACSNLLFNNRFDI